MYKSRFDDARRHSDVDIDLAARGHCRDIDAVASALKNMADAAEDGNTIDVDILILF